MRVETVQVALRPRSAWEAMELGNALVRRHAGTIWRAWLLCSLPVFALVHALGWWFDQMGLAALLMWWLLPVFDRVPLYVLSRAVFGAAPTLGQTLAAQRRWGWRAVAGYVGWRRFSPWRAVSLPVALLEGVQGTALTQRRRLMVDGVGGHTLLLTAIGHLFVLTLIGSQVALLLLFVPTELLSESARAMWALVTEQPPRWVQLLGNLGIWLALGLIAPFQMGAGFGLYLNRRTQLEAWDLEIAFRRLRARLAPGVASLAAASLACLLVFAPGARAQDATPGAEATPTLPAVFGAPVDDPAFERAVAEAYTDPLLVSSRTQVRWQRKDRAASKAASRQLPAGIFGVLTRMLAFVAEFGLWIVLGLLVLALVLTARRWWPWMRGVAVRAPVEHAITVGPAPPLPEPLPDALLEAVRALWAAGERRRALALLYRASVAVMAQRAGVTLVPGATEAECLRASRRMPEADDRGAFAEMVRVWQRAAYGQRLPDDAAFDALLDTLAPRFGWVR